MTYYAIKMVNLNKLYYLTLSDFWDQDMRPFQSSMPIFEDEISAKKAAKLVEEMYDCELKIIKLKEIS